MCNSCEKAEKAYNALVTLVNELKKVHAPHIKKIILELEKALGIYQKPVI